MLNLREEILKDWNRLLDKASEMVQIAKERNVLMKECKEREREFSERKERYEKMISDVENFVELNTQRCADSEICNCAKSFVEAVKNEIKCIENDAEPYLNKYAKVVELTNEIENYIEYISKFTGVFKNIRLTANEYSENQLHELIAVLLIANSNKPKITEENFFESTHCFYGLLESSNNPVLQELLSYKSDSIVNCNNIYDFLESLN